MYVLQDNFELTSSIKCYFCTFEFASWERGFKCKSEAYKKGFKKCLHWVLVSVDKSRAEQKVQVLSKLWQWLILLQCFITVCSVICALISLVRFCWWV